MAELWMLICYMNISDFLIQVEHLYEVDKSSSLSKKQKSSPSYQRQGQQTT